MTRFYGTKEYVSYVDGIKDVRGVIAKCKAPGAWNLRNWMSDCFGRPLAASSTSTALQKPPPPTKLDTLHRMMEESLAAIVNLLERQYKKQFKANADEIAEMTQSARSNNIACEEIMGMMSASLQRAPSATMTFHAGRIKAQKNKVTQFLEEADPQLVRRAVKLGGLQLRHGRKLQQELWEELDRRQRQKAAAQEKKDRNAVEKKMKTIKLGECHSAFPDLSDRDIGILEDLLAGCSVRLCVCHVWTDGGTGKPIVYNGRIESFDKDERMYVVGYWDDTGSYDNAEDFDMTAVELATDFVMHDLTI
jgi:hypothetical protein